MSRKDDPEALTERVVRYIAKETNRETNPIREGRADLLAVALTHIQAHKDAEATIESECRGSISVKSNPAVNVLCSMMLRAESLLGSLEGEITAHRTVTPTQPIETPEEADARIRDQAMAEWRHVTN